MLLRTVAQARQILSDVRKLGRLVGTVDADETMLLKFQRLLEKAENPEDRARLQSLVNDCKEFLDNDRWRMEHLTARLKKRNVIVDIEELS